MAAWSRVRPIGFVLIPLRWLYYAAIKFHLGWNCNWTCAMHNQCHCFQVQNNIRKWNTHQYCTMLKMKTRATHQILNRYSSMHREFILVTYFFQLSSSNCKRTGFDWAVGRKDLQGFNIAPTSSLCGLDWTFTATVSSFCVDSRCSMRTYNGLWYLPSQGVVYKTFVK
jgi:hypothetical protein